MPTCEVIPNNAIPRCRDGSATAGRVSDADFSDEFGFAVHYDKNHRHVLGVTHGDLSTMRKRTPAG
jgi:hypothetical protein